MQIYDFITVRKVTPPIRIKALVYEHYNVVEHGEYHGPCISCGKFSEIKELDVSSNEILVEAIRIGARIAQIRGAFEGLDEESYLKGISPSMGTWHTSFKRETDEEIQLILGWCKRYGLIPSGLSTWGPTYEHGWTDEKFLRRFNAEKDNEIFKTMPFSTFSNPLVEIFYLSHVWFKAEYGEGDFFSCDITKKLSQAFCITELANHPTSNIQHKLEYKNETFTKYRACSTLDDLLRELLFDVVATGDNGERFECELCGTLGIRKHGKRKYCPSCSEKRYAVSREKKKKRERGILFNAEKERE